MTRLICISAAISLALVACGAPDSGRVADGRYHPASSYWVSGTSPICSGSGSSRVCTPGTPGHMQFNPESWELRIINGDEDGWRNVDETTFHRCNVDEHFPECADPTKGDVR
jgi:hypothetical protein